MNTLATAPARLRITHAESEGALIRFAFGAVATGDDPLRIPCARLAGPDTGESWWAGAISESAVGPAAPEGHLISAVTVTMNKRGAFTEFPFSGRQR